VENCFNQKNFNVQVGLLMYVVGLYDLTTAAENYVLMSITVINLYVLIYFAFNFIMFLVYAIDFQCFSFQFQRTKGSLLNKGILDILFHPA
jgi:hypothetical protein